MWETIISAAALTFLIRSLPSWSARLRQILQNRRINRLLDYTVCFITGELIYSLIASNLEDNEILLSKSGTFFVISALTILASSLATWYTDKIGRSFAAGLATFVFLYSLLLT